jgi:hypothetical protein
VNPLEIKPLTFQLVAQCLNQMHRVPGLKAKATCFGIYVDISKSVQNV